MSDALTQADASLSRTGAQRLSLDRLRRFEAMRFGMFIHFGMATFVGVEVPAGTEPSSVYAPDQLDVEQWISVARDAGMKYAVLTTKHGSGHCLWPSRHTDYHVGTSGNRTDVVEAFVSACQRKGVAPGFYYSHGDCHHLFGSKMHPATPGLPWENSYTTDAYREFESNQIEELLTQYGNIEVLWFDVPRFVPRDYRHRQYQRIAELQPNVIVVGNNGVSNAGVLNVNTTWPTDVLTLERLLPKAYAPWHQIEGKEYYLPGEACGPIGREWFYTDGDQPRGDAELLGLYLVSVSRGANFLLNVPPDRHGRIPEKWVGPLSRLRRNLDQLRL